jgi:magnesium transporter
MLQVTTTENGQDAFFCFLSDLLGKKVRTAAGEPLGKFEDVIAIFDATYPEVVALCVSKQGSKSCIHLDGLDLVSLARFGTHRLQEDILFPFAIDDRHFYVRDVLFDRQIVDVNGAKVERVNDVAIQIRDRRAYLTHVDVGFTGLVRRLGFERGLRWMTSVLRRPSRDALIDWRFVQPLPEVYTSPIHISLRQEEIKDLHAGELADILEELDRQERITFVHTIGLEDAADALEEADISVQTSIIRDLETELAADILEEMEPAVAADVMDKLPSETQDSILAAMDEEDRVLLEVLVSAKEDSAASLMTVDFISCPETYTVAEGLAQIRQYADDVESITYIYCLDEILHLTGVVSIRELLLGEQTTPISEIMNRRLITLRMDDDLNDIAAQFMKLRFKALPVVDKNNCMLGIVTFLHSFDELLPHYYKLRG